MRLIVTVIAIVALVIGYGGYRNRRARLEREQRAAFVKDSIAQAEAQAEALAQRAADDSARARAIADARRQASEAMLSQSIQADSYRTATTRRTRLAPGPTVVIKQPAPTNRRP